MQIKNLTEIPNGKSQWQTRYGMDTHALGGFSPENYRRPALGEEYSYAAPTAAFAGVGKGKAVNGFRGHVEVDYLGNPATAGREPGMGHIQYTGKQVAPKNAAP